MSTAFTHSNHTGTLSPTTVEWQPLQLAKLCESPQRRRASATEVSHRWGIVLAGGDGTRLRELTQRVWGDRPKQYCPILSDRTLLEETQRRAELSIPREQILLSLMQAHEQYYLPSLGRGPSPRLVQPCNKGTAPAILYGLLRIAQMDADAIVTIFPCDHYYSPESALTGALESVLEIAARHPRSLILLAAEPDEAEIEYGWIEIGEGVGRQTGLFRVDGFYEKPSRAVAEALLETGSLWNTSVIAGHVRAFLNMAWEKVPDLLELLDATAYPSHGAEVRIPASVYAQITPVDFSHQVLAFAANRLLAFQMEEIDWSDLGNPDRVFSALLRRNGNLPAWAKLWFGAKEAPRVAMAGAGKRWFS
jgi:mannose-1-phosphate guanylyltransferase